MGICVSHITLFTISLAFVGTQARIDMHSVLMSAVTLGRQVSVTNFDFQPCCYEDQCLEILIQFIALRVEYYTTVPFTEKRQLPNSFKQSTCHFFTSHD